MNAAQSAAFDVHLPWRTAFGRSARALFRSRRNSQAGSGIPPGTLLNAIASVVLVLVFV